MTITDRLHALAHLRFRADEEHAVIVTDAHPAVEGVAARLGRQRLGAGEALAHGQQAPAHGKAAGHGQRGDDEMTTLHGGRA